MRAPKRSSLARAPRVALATALALCSSLIPPRGVGAYETESWHAPVCGARAPATCASSLSAWERDVHALQALHHHCGVDADGNRAPAWDEPWGAVASFSGSRDDWDAVCDTSNAWHAREVAASSAIVTCDWTGRVLSINIDGDRHGIKLDCNPIHGLPPEFESLSELVAVRIAGAMRPASSGGENGKRKTEIAEIMRPLAALRRLAVVSLNNNGLVGRVPDVCDTHLGYAFDSQLERLELSENALTGAFPGDGLACAQHLRTLDASYNHLTGVLPDVWADSMHQLRVLRFNNNPHLTGSIPTAWFPPLGGDDDDAAASGAGSASAGAYRLGNLVELDGTDCDLTGHLPANLGGASWLATLRLGGNRLEGAVPGSVTRLTQLRELSLRRNALSGHLPANLFAALANSLRTVDLALNAFTGAPPPFPTAGYPVLRDVDLSENDFEGPFESFGAVLLMRLSLAHNGLTGTFPSPCGSGFLDHIDIQGNAFDGVFPDIACLSQLTFLDASGNKFETLAGDGGWIVRNRVVDVSFRSNALRGNLPSDGICGPYTRRVDLSGNRGLLGAIPESVGDCVSLHELRLGETLDVGSSDDVEDASPSGDEGTDGEGSVSGVSFSFPSEATLARLTRLTHLHLRGVGLEGAVPRSLFALPGLVELDLSHNRLAGELPSALPSADELSGGDFRWPANLHRLALSRNNLTGVVPSSLLALRALRKLYLARNAFEGVEAFPAETPPATNDDAAANETTPASETTPATESDASSADAFSFAARLDVLDLSSNALRAFPGALERVGGLTAISLANNGMRGPIPPWLGERDTLVHVRLDGNALEGSLESWLGTNRLLDLQSLRVDGNPGISGPLSPNAIRRMTRLKRLNVSGVTSFGAFPHGLGVAGASLDALTHLHARGSGLNGTLPATLFAALPNLRTLDLRDNALSGFVPGDHLRTHASLETLLLSNNTFNGAFPRLSDALETRAEETRDTFGADHARAKVVDLRGAGDEASGGFECPLPRDAAAYADLECTCPAGRAGADAGRFTCAPCAPGAFSANAGASECHLCPAGRFAGTHGAVACAPCAPGTASETAGSARCEPCGLGFFAALEASATCDACNPGTFAGEEGSVTCEACPVGAAAARPASASCDTCAPGTFAAEPAHAAIGSTECAKCAPGTFSDAEGSTVCHSCAPGHVARTEGSSTCVACDEGTFAALSGSSACVACAPGSVAAARGATFCDACAKGTFAAAEGGVACASCPLGTFGAEEGKGACESCPLGTFADETGREACEACPKGAFANEEGSATCRACPLGTFQNDQGASSCVSCPKGAFANEEGAETCASCPLGTFADETGTAQCAPCAVGSFADAEGAEACVSCPAGAFAEAEASASCAQCAPGTFQNATGASVCVSCPLGTISSAAAATQCSTCPAGSFSDQTGATKCASCLPGSFAGAGAGACAACGAGFFAADARAPTCAACPAGTFQNSTGQASCVACPAGTASDREGAGGEDACAACPAGTSTEGKAGAATCARCGAGAFAAAGSGACALASPGAVASVAGATEQTLCPPGTHAPGRGNTECLLCPANHAAPYAGASACAPCPPGSESPEGASACVCAGGYRDATATAAASADGSVFAFSLERGPVCVACEPGTHSDGAPFGACATCPPDAFAPGNATKTCAKIEPGHVGSDFVEPTARRGARAQTPCPAGFQSRDTLVGLALAPQCEACPEGTVAPLVGSDACAACAPGFEPDAARVVCLSVGGAGAGATRGDGSTGGSERSPADPFDYEYDYGATTEDEFETENASSAGAMSAKTSAAAFFALLGACALSLFLFLRWWRARRARARRLALEREAALEAAEEDIAETGKIRRATLFALAHVDAEAAACGENLAKDPSRSDPSRSDRGFPKPRFLDAMASLNPFKGASRRDAEARRERRSRYSAARVARAASGILTAGPAHAYDRRMSVARRVDRLDRLERLSRARGASYAAQSRLRATRRRADLDDSESDADAESPRARLHDASAFSDDRSADDEEAAFESAVLAAARRASRFERDRRDRRRGSRATTRLKGKGKGDDETARENGNANTLLRDGGARDDHRRRLLDAPGSSGERGDRSDGGGAPDASEASLTLLSDVIVETEARGEAARRPWKMFRGGAKP